MENVLAEPQRHPNMRVDHAEKIWDGGKASVYTQRHRAHGRLDTSINLGERKSRGNRMVRDCAARATMHDDSGPPPHNHGH